MIHKIIFIILLANFVFMESIDNAAEKQNGIKLFLNAVNILINGDAPGDKTYKDLFIDTSKNIYSQIENANEQVTIDDMLRIFVQSVLILVANRRPDLIPDDFNERHKEYGTVINELNYIFDMLNERGTGYINIGAMSKLIKNLRSNEFWASVSSLQKEVAQKIDDESPEDDDQRKAKIKIKNIVEKLSDEL